MTPPDISNIYITTAIFLGALHAFEPGHGKSIMAAYLVGTSGKIADAIELGLVIAFTHTFSVISLGILMKAASEAFLRKSMAPIVELIASLLIVIVGLWILKSSLNCWKESNNQEKTSSVKIKEDNQQRKKSAKIVMNRNIRYEKESGLHFHPQLESGEIKSKWQILILGFSSGIIPCPAGIAILLAAIADGKISRGLTLVLFFSLGVALTILAIAIIVSKLSEIARYLFLRKSKIIKWIPFASGIVISCLGLITFFRALTKI